ncbi:DUF2207 domain-containing protein [Streptomyces sp. NPDC001904]|uniref:DUF2207 domain-containing protein n=1 Tax=Streptomyces sp. NPDC001904 TaxID=3154531 RepID=UPI0033187BB4
MSDKSGAGGRRIRGLVWLVFSVLVLGCVTWFAGAAGNSERVTRMWVSAEVRKDGSARVTEVIDYDFGHPLEGLHGIWRDIPGLTYAVEDDDVTATMDGRPAPYELSYGNTSDRSIRVGDADRTVTGPHRYRITYPLPDVVKNGKLAWDAVGTGWKVDLHDVEIHVAAPYGLDGVRCVRGRTASTQSCRAAQPESGHLVAAPGTVPSGHGVTLYASADRSGAVQAADPAPPAGTRPDAEAAPNPFRTGWKVAVLALVCGLSTIAALRLLGRDRRAAELARPLPGTPPEGLTPAQGGILLTEHIRPHHQVAWLLGTAARGHLSITGSGRHPVLRRTRGSAGAPADEDTTAVLDDMFAGRKDFVLGTYDPWFRSAWQTLGARLAVWQRTSDLWDPAAERRAHAGLLTGLGAALAGVVAAITGSALISHVNAGGPPTAISGAVLTGVGMALCLCSWELKRRTARGAALRLQVESFRQWLAEADATAQTEDAERFELLTAWAVALGLATRWEHSIEESTAPDAPGTARRTSTLTRLGPALAVGLIAASAASATAPSSSGGSGGSGGGSSSGGGVGGGTGGGGGGSW